MVGGWGTSASKPDPPSTSGTTSWGGGGGGGPPAPSSTALFRLSRSCSNFSHCTSNIARFNPDFDMPSQFTTSMGDTGKCCVLRYMVGTLAKASAVKPWYS
jgi:hypothetical protein